MQASLKSPHERVRPAPVAWDSSRHGLRVEIYGAGGALGREIACALLASGHPPARLRLYARSARKLSWRGQELQITPIPSTLSQADVAFLCTPPHVARALAPHLGQLGTRSLDLSGAFRGDPEVPLVLEDVNAEELGAFTELIAMPLRSSVVLARALAVLEREVGLGDVGVFAVLSAASRGARGIFELRAELQEHGAERRRIGDLRLAQDESGADPGEEIVRDVRRLLRRPDLLCDASAVEGDLERCDFFAVKTLLYSALEPLDAAELFAADSGLEVSEREALAASSAVGCSRVHVARIRAGSRGPRSLCFFVLGDQLRAGAAAALQVAARLPAPV